MSGSGTILKSTFCFKNFAIIGVVLLISGCYDISMYRGDCCIKRLGSGKYSYGFEVDFGKFLLSNNENKNYNFEQLPPHRAWHTAMIRVYNFSDTIKEDVLNVQVNLKAWTKSKEIFNIQAKLSDFYMNRYNMGNDKKKDESVQFYFRNYKKEGKGPDSFFLQDSLHNENLNLSVSFDSVSDELLAKKIFVSLFITVTGRSGR